MILPPTTFQTAVRFERTEYTLKTEALVSEQETGMKFCRDCNNFLYSIEEREKKAYLKCRSCPYEEEVTKANPIVYEHDLHQDTSVQYSINPYLKYDPTLPRFTNMICPNDGCVTRGKDSNIVGIKLDAVNVVWLYQCAACDTTWKQLARG
jgi:DNA-directed RNA polymerase subunit M/transcription elongation factor TFIIS